MFILLSDACLPIVSFKEAQQELLGEGDWNDDESIFDMHDDKQHKAQRQYLQDFLEREKEKVTSGKQQSISEGLQLLDDLLVHSTSKSKPDGLSAHSQWCVLSRTHAEILCKEEDIKRRELLLSAYSMALDIKDVHDNMTLAPDELFVLTYLRDYSRSLDSRKI